MPVVQKFRCQVQKLIDFGDHVYTVDLCAERPVPRFLPGQFLHLALDDYDPSGFWPESRVFSIASSPGQRERLRISYSVQGRFTTRMEGEIKEGRWVWVKLPYGEFVIDDTSDVVLFAGGTGITAFTAFLEGLTPQFQHRVYLLYGARRRRLLIYRDLVQEEVQKVPKLHCFYFIEQDADEHPTQSDGTRINETIGKLSVETLWPKIKTPLEVTYYLSGPPLMLRVFSRTLHDFGIPSEAIKTDAWE